MFNREEYIINMIKDMDINDRLRLGVAMFSSSFINTSYNKKEMVEKMDSKLKEIGCLTRILLIFIIYGKNYIMKILIPWNHTELKLMKLDIIVLQ